MIANSRLSLVIFIFQLSAGLFLGIFQQPANLLSQFGIFGVAMTRNGVADRGVEHFLFGAFDP